MSQPLKISCFIVCCNEEAHISRCINSVREWCNEVIVIDSGSTDQTVALAKELGATVIHQPWLGFVEQKRLGLQKSSGEWVINLDADEEVSPELKEEIVQAITAVEASASRSELNGFELNRVVFFLNRWWRVGGWYPEYRLRVLRRTAAAWGGTNPHERAEIVSGRTQRLSGELRHYTYDDIADQIRALNSHSSVAAHSLFIEGYRPSLADLLLRPLARFVKFYFTKGGWREGRAGLIVALHEAAYVVFKYSKAWEKLQQKAVQLNQNN